MAETEPPASAAGDSSLTYSELLVSFLLEIIRSPVNIGLVAVIALLVYKIFRSRNRTYEPPYQIKQLPRLRKDFTVEELKPYNGTGPDGRILVAVNGNVYDVTRGARFYGPGKISQFFIIKLAICLVTRVHAKIAKIYKKSIENVSYFSFTCKYY